MKEYNLERGTNMKAIILSAKTGSGHNSVMNAIYSMWNTREIDIEVFPSFYEDLLPSNKILSDFYNLLQVKSVQLCKEFTEMSVLRNRSSIDEVYITWREALYNFFEKVECDIIISTTPLINPYIILFLKEFSKDKKFYIVVTDPYNPIYPGFAVKGATGYFVANNVVKELLETFEIDSSKIYVTGYPLHRKFIQKDNGERILEGKKWYFKGRTTILVNCGAQGSFHFIKIIEKIYRLYADKMNIVVICGKNRMLYNICRQRFNIILFDFVDFMDELLKEVDLCVTKAGANTVHECLYMGVPILIDGLSGYLYQEEGIKHFLKKQSVGECFDTLLELEYKLEKLLERNGLEQLKANILSLQFENGTSNIIMEIFKEERRRNGGCY